MPRIVHVLPLALLAAHSPLAARSFEDIDGLEVALIEALGTGVGEPGGPAAPLDRRLKLAPCPAAPVFDTAAAGAVAIRCPAAGWRLYVALRRGAAAAERAHVAFARATEPLVRRGDSVALIAEGRGFSVSREAIAEQDGAAGARIRVRLEPRRPPIIAEVVREGEVRLPRLN